MTKTFLTISLVLLSFVACFSQEKSFEAAQEEIKNFTDFAGFSFSYDETKYLTKAEISLEMLDEKDDLRKQFSKFEWRLTSLFALKGIDAKPVRNVLCVNSQSKNFVFARENALTIFFPDGDASLGEPNRSSEVKRGRASEKLCWDVDQQLFQDFGASEKIDFQIGSVKGRIKPDKMRIFKDYARLLRVKDAAAK